MTCNSFDLISDVHLDEIMDSYNSWTLDAYVSSILPQSPSSTLIFAGDFGLYNDHTIEFLKLLKKTYSHILYVYGNNDIKVRIQDQPIIYTDAGVRVKEFEKQVKELENVIHLDGQVVEIDGIRYGGSNIFYDFDSMNIHFAMTKQECERLWKHLKLHIKHKGYIDDPHAFAEQEKEKLRLVIPRADVIVTHAPPDYFMDTVEDYPGFYRFDGEEFLQYLEGKVWCFGHQHQRMINREYKGCRFYNASYVGSYYSRIVTVQLNEVLS
ncbi:hypothetical protein CN918_30155 [Priestia megaterium]|nr:hypothetical protein CN918_30155 [Priestia megaterium]